MAKIVEKNQPCLDQVDCRSTNARQVYEDGGSYCFSCTRLVTAAQAAKMESGELDTPKKATPSPTRAPIDTQKVLGEIRGLHSKSLQDRKVSKEVCEHYGVKVSFNSDGEIVSHYYPYGDSYKRRKLPKMFSWVGPMQDTLFGMERFNPGGKRIVICEGEIDTLVVAEATYQRYNKFYPVVGMSSAVMIKSLIEAREYLRQFDEVVLCLDQDKAGQEATMAAIKIIGIDKVKIVKLPTKDAGETMLLDDGAKLLMQAIYDAAPFIPSGFITKDELWDRMRKRKLTPCIPYPPCMAGVNSKLKGMRAGEITLFISGTGSGKSTLLREDIIHLIDFVPPPPFMIDDELIFQPVPKIGVISLEESPEETAEKLAGMMLSRNPAHEEISEEDIKPAFDKLFGEDRIVLLDHQGSMGDQSVIDKLEYMCLIGCTHIFIDHLTILVSEGVEQLRGNEAQDKIMNDLLRLVKKYPVWIGLVSHLRKAQNGGSPFEEGHLPSMDDIKGSGSVKQISMDIISFARDMSNDDEVVRNTVLMRILKARTTGDTGPVPGATYDLKTGRLTASLATTVEANKEQFTRLE
jgi:twinkle protein